MALFRPFRSGGGFVPPIKQAAIFSGGSKLSRTPSVTGDRQRFTLLARVKRAKLGATQYIVGGLSGSDPFYIQFDASDRLRIYCGAGGAGGEYVSTRVFRDVGYYSLGVAYDSVAQSITAAVNDEEITDWTTASAPGAGFNAPVNLAGAAMEIGAYNGTANLEAVLADLHWLEGTALTPAQMIGATIQLWPFGGGAVKAPKKVTGLPYGTNGAHLDFSNAADFGEDQSGNGNDFTATGFSSDDQVPDVPGREYAVLNPLALPSGFNLSDGGLAWDSGSGGNTGLVKASLPVPATGKWYFEYTEQSSNLRSQVGFFKVGETDEAATERAMFYTYYGRLYPWGSASQTVDDGGLSVGDVIGVAVDRDTGEMWVRRPSGWINSADPASAAGLTDTIPASEELVVGVVEPSGSVAGAGEFNFGQRPWAYSPPAGFKALSTDNLPTPEWYGGDWFEAVARAGDGVDDRVVSTPFAVDLYWGKERSNTDNHALVDTVRGPLKGLSSNNTDAENSFNHVKAFAANSITLGNSAQVNASGQAYVDWLWRAGGAGVINSAGTIQSTVSVAEAGHFGVISYTGTGAVATVGHGLPGAPELVTCKGRAGGNWETYHKAVGPTQFIRLNDDTAPITGSTVWDGTDPTDSVIHLGCSPGTNPSGSGVIAYAFRSVPGLCKVGSFEGSADAFVFLGFKPRWLLYKPIDAAGSWKILDTARDPYNQIQNRLMPDLSSVEGGGAEHDFVSTGFRLRGATSNTVQHHGVGGVTYIYVALAEEAGGGLLPWPLAA